MTEPERQMRRGLSSLLLEAPVSVVRDLSARVQAREDELSSEIVRLRTELDEQARLNGMGAERELALRGEVERLRREVERMRLTLEDIRDGYGPQHGSEWCRTKAAIGLLTSMKASPGPLEQSEPKSVI